MRRDWYLNEQLRTSFNLRPLRGLEEPKKLRTVITQKNTINPHGIIANPYKRSLAFFQ